MLGKCVITEEVEYFPPNEEEAKVEVQASQKSTSSSLSSEEKYVPPEKVS